MDGFELRESPVSDEQGLRLGRVVSVSGSQVVILLENRDNGKAAEEASALQMGALVKMRTPGSTVFGLVSGLSIPIPGQDAQDNEMKIVELELLGEAANDANGGQGSFQRGVAVFPALGDIVYASTQDDRAAFQRSATDEADAPETGPLAIGLGTFLAQSFPPITHFIDGVMSDEGGGWLGGLKLRPSGWCTRCGRRVCPRCYPDRARGELCDACNRLLYQPEQTDRDLRLARLEALRAREARLDKVAWVASIALPGAAGVLAKRPLRSVVGAICFAVAAVALFFREGAVPDPLVAGAAGPFAFFVVASLFGGVYAIVVGTSLAARRGL